MKTENIPGWSGYYVTKSGKVYSNKTGKWVKRKTILAGDRHQVLLSRQLPRKDDKHHRWGKVNHEKKWFKVSRLVAEVYIPNPHNYPIVCHKDNNPLNNHVSNLYWGTQSMNIQQAIADGRFQQCYRYGKDNPMYGKTGPMKGIIGSLHPAYGNKYRLGKKHSQEVKNKIGLSIKLLNRTKISNEKRKLILDLYGKGKTQSYISNTVGLHQTTISKVINGIL